VGLWTECGLPNLGNSICAGAALSRMGVLLSKPNTEKEYDEGESDKLAFAACSMQVAPRTGRMPPPRASPRADARMHLRAHALSWDVFCCRGRRFVLGGGGGWEAVAEVLCGCRGLLS
jgi:hypothetical protein